MAARLSRLWSCCFSCSNASERMGETKLDLGLAVSGASSATSGGTKSDVTWGDMVNGGGFKLPKWTAPVVIVALFVISIVLVIRH